MVAIVSTVAYLGLEARAVEVQCQIAPGMVGFAVVGLPDKAVAESRERVRAAIAALGLSLPPKRITINLSPADLPKEGSHYDLPIALALMAAMGLVDAETLSHYVVVGDLGLDGRVAASPGVLLAPLHASGRQMGLICPAGGSSCRLFVVQLRLELRDERVAAGVLVAITALIGSRPEPAGTAAGWAGTVLESAEPKPATVLWDTEGRPVDLREGVQRDGAHRAAPTWRRATLERLVSTS